MQNIEGVASYTHPDYSAILVFIEYLCALEVRCMISYDITIHYVYVPYILSTVWQSIPLVIAIVYYVYISIYL